MKARVLYISGSLLVDIFTRGTREAEVVENALPEDTEIVRAHYDPLKERLELVVKSEEFSEVAVGHAFPEHPGITFRAVERMR